MRRLGNNLGIGIALGVFCLQLILLPRVGMSWDEPASFFIGRANLKFWLTGNRAYIDDIQNPSLFRDSPIQYIYGEDVYPPFPFLVSSMTSFVLAEKLHLVDVFTAHHMGELAIAAFGVWGMFGLAIEAGLVPVIAGLIAAVYATYPTFFQYMRNDPKDMPLVSMLIVASYFAFRTVKAWRKNLRGSVWRNGIGFSLFFGLAAGSKPTAAFLVPVFIVWIVLSCYRNKPLRREFINIPFVGVWIIFLATSIGVFFFLWPWLWAHPIGRLTESMSFFKTVGFNMPTMLFGELYHAGINLPAIYPFVILLIQTPIELTLLAAIGTAAITARFLRSGTFYPFLFVVWFWLLICRFLLPMFIIYSRVRHFIDAMPAFFILVGFGALTVARVISKKRSVGIAIAILAVAVLHQAWISYQFFPYEEQYFNVLTGGSKTVAEKNLYDIGTSTAVREAVEFINRDSGGAPVAIYPCLLAHIIRFYVAPNVRITTLTGNAQYTIVPNSITWFEGALTFVKNHHALVYTVRRAGADLLYVYKYKDPIGWRCGWETKSNYTYD
jgi:hypothetical protein